MSINSTIVVQDNNLNRSRSKIMICLDFRIFWNVPMNVALNIMSNLYKHLCRKWYRRMKWWLLDMGKVLITALSLYSDLHCSSHLYEVIEGFEGGMKFLFVPVSFGTADYWYCFCMSQNSCGCMSEELYSSWYQKHLHIYNDFRCWCQYGEGL